MAINWDEVLPASEVDWSPEASGPHGATAQCVQTLNLMRIVFRFGVRKFRFRVSFTFYRSC